MSKKEEKRRTREVCMADPEVMTNESYHLWQRAPGLSHGTRLFTGVKMMQGACQEEVKQLRQSFAETAYGNPDLEAAVRREMVEKRTVE